MILAVGTETQPGWGGPLALLIGFVIFRVVVMPLGKWIREMIKNSSPTPVLEGVRRTKVQATVGVTEDEPTEPAEIGWWGRIVEVGGLRYRKAKQIMATGSSELPEDGEEDEPLEDEAAEEDGGEKIDDYIARARGLGVPYNQIVRVVTKHYGVSESTAKRRIRDVDEQRRAA